MPRHSKVERLAMELRQIDCEDAAQTANALTRDAEANWRAAAEPLRYGYLRDARRLLKLLDSLARRPASTPTGDEP